MKQTKTPTTLPVSPRAPRAARHLAAALVALAGAAVASTAARAAEPAPAPKPTVAILYFDYQGKDEGMSLLKKGLAQMLISDLSDLASVQIVERDRLQDLIDELKLNESKKIDKDTANKIGKLLGARIMVLGGYFDLMGTLRVDARVVETETGRVLKSVGANGKQDDFMGIEGQVAKDLRLALDTAAVGPDGVAPPPKTRPEQGGDAKPRVKRPKKLQTKTAARYGKALDAMDKGKKEEAKQELEAIVAEEPEFELAALDLAALAQ